MMRTGLTWTRPFSSARPALTLVEIMVVVAIIGILAAIGIWSAGRLSDDAKSRQTQQILDMLQNSISLFKGEKGAYIPWPTVTDLDDNPRYKGESFGAFEDGDALQKRADYWQDAGRPEDGVSAPGMLILRAKADGDRYSVNATTPAIYGIPLFVYVLSSIEEGRSIINRLPDELKTAVGGTGMAPTNFRIEPATHLGLADPQDTSKARKVEPAVWLLDAWKRPLYYGWNQNVNNGVPYLQSAGPDGIWGSADDLYSFARAGQ